MPSASFVIYPKFQALIAGVPANGAKVFFYAPGTTTKQTTYTTPAGDVQNANPVVLDSRGETNVCLDSTLLYKIVLAPSTDSDPPVAPIWTVDNVGGDTDVRVDLAASGGSALSGFLQSGTGAVARTVQAKERDTVSVKDFGAVGDGSNDDTAEIQAAITAVGSGGRLYFPPGAYKVTSPLLAEDLRGITLVGSSGQYTFGGSRIVASHTGKAVLSLVGSLFATVENLILEGATASRPKTGLLLGRSSAASASNHTFINMQTAGYFSVAAVYNVSSESNTWINPTLSALAAPIASYYESQTDTQSIGGLTGSSMEGTSMFGGTIANYDTTAGSACIMLDVGSSTGHTHFHDTFLAKAGGDAFIRFRVGSTDGAGTEFPIGFHNISGEIGASAPTTGLHFLSGAGILTVAGFTATNLRLQTPATNNILVDPNTVAFSGAKISTPYRAAGNKPSTFYRCDGCELSLLSEDTITIADLRGSSLTYLFTPPTITSGVRNVLRDIGGVSYKVDRQEMAGSLVLKPVVIAYSASMAVNLALGNSFLITATDGVAFTVGFPTNLTSGQEFVITIANATGGALGAATWSFYKMAAWVQPGTATQRSIRFRTDGTNCFDMRPGADVPN